MNTIHCEWDYETIDAESGDILNHNHADKLTDFTHEDKTDSLVLIRDSGNEAQGLQDRLWAYVVGHKLPEFFTDSLGNPTSYKVPARFHKELTNYLTSNTV